MISPVRAVKTHASLADVAKLAGCTAASVSLVLNDSPLPSARMRARVRQAAADIGYVPNRIAQSLKRGRTTTWGMVMSYCADSHAAAFMDAMSAEASRLGFQLEVHFHRWSVEEEDRALTILGESRVAGVFLSGSRSNYKSAPVIASLKRQKIPIVSIGRNARPEFDSSIVVDRMGGFVSLARHLAGLGHRRMDYLEPIMNREMVETYPPDIQGVIDALNAEMRPWSRDARVGFHHMRPESLSPRREIESRGFSALETDAFIDRFIADYLGSGSRATAILTHTAAHAWKLLGALAERGIRCPQDVSVASLSVENVCSMGAVPVTAAEYSVELMAQKAIRNMMTAMSGRKAPAQSKIPTRLAIRRSTAMPSSKKHPQKMRSH